MKDLVEVANSLRNDQGETGKLARKILAGYRSLVRSEKNLEAVEKEYKELKMKEGVKKHGRVRESRGKGSKENKT
jgi:hypothetical protein